MGVFLDIRARIVCATALVMLLQQCDSAKFNINELLQSFHCATVCVFGSHSSFTSVQESAVVYN